MPFFVEVRGLKKIMTSPGRDRDWAKTAVGITGLSENFVRDSGIEEPYWGPSVQSWKARWELAEGEKPKNLDCTSKDLNPNVASMLTTFLTNVEIS